MAEQHTDPPQSLSIAMEERSLEITNNNNNINININNNNDNRVNSFLGIMLRIYIEATETNLHLDASFRTHSEEHRLALAAKAARIKLNRKQLMFRLMASYLCLKQATLMILQYSFEFSAIKYERYKTHLRNGSSSINVKEQQQQQLTLLENQMLSYRNALKLIGAPFMNMSFVFECMLVFLIWNVVSFYLSKAAYSKFICPFNSSLLRALQGFDREQANITGLIQNELYILLESSHMYLSKNFKQPIPISSKIIHIKTSFERYLSKLTSRDFKSIRPTNREPDFIRKIGTILLSVYSMFLFSSILTLIAFVAYGPAYTECKLETSTQAIINLAEFIGFTVISSSVIGIGLSVHICAFIDQIYLVHIMIRDINKCIVENYNIHRELMKLESDYWQDFHKTNKNSTPKRCSRRQSKSACAALVRQKSVYSAIEQKEEEEASRSSIVGRRIDQLSQEERYLIDRMNENLVKILLQYRIFVSQVQPLQHRYSHSILVFTCFYAIYPLYLLLHVPYMPRKSIIALVVQFWLYVVCYDLLAAPICVFHAQCKKLFRNLLRLLAHISEIQTKITTIPNYEISIYNPIVISLLRKEIGDPLLSISSVSIKFLSGSFGYKNLLTVNFWTGLLSLYAIFADEKGSLRANSVSTSGRHIAGVPSIIEAFV